MKRGYKILALAILGLLAFRVAGFAQTQISNQKVTPSVVTFTSADPDTPAASATTATASFSTKGGSASNTWTLAVKSDNTVFNNCTSSIPPSAITAACASVSGSGNTTGSCLAPVSLSTAYQTIASGFEGPGNKDYSVVVSFLFNDSWSYVPSNTSCRLAIRYRMTAN